MCILFCYVNPSPSFGRFSVVLANNRDEVFSRPATGANFWPHNGDCISGLDKEPGKENGTWFGLSKRGKCGCLLNILKPKDPTAQGRGHLVTDYLESDTSMGTYLEDLYSKSDEYNAFNLFLLEKRLNESSDVIVVSNSEMSGPRRKAKEGEAIFGEIVREYGSVPAKEVLIEKLRHMLMDNTKYWPDEVLQNQNTDVNMPEDVLKTLSGIFVDASANYGTRTSTIVTIDSSGNCDYYEWTLDPEKMDWETRTFNFMVNN